MATWRSGYVRCLRIRLRQHVVHAHTQEAIDRYHALVDLMADTASAFQFAVMPVLVFVVCAPASRRVQFGGSAAFAADV